MDAFDLHWLAGLLEGEACFGWSVPRNHYGSPVVTLVMTDEDVVRRVAGLIHAECVHKKTAKNPKHRDVFKCCVYSGKAAAVMRLVQPLMGSRRGAKIEECLALWDSRPGVSGYARVLPQSTRDFILSKTHEGVNPSRLATMLNEKGVPTPTGKGRWFNVSITNFLARERKIDAMRRRA